VKHYAMILSSVAMLVLPPAAHGITWHVPSPILTIQEAIDSAAYGDTVLVACGTYYEHDIFMKSGVCLKSETGEANCVAIDAQQQGRVMYCSGVDNAASIEGFTLTGGSIDGERGGGMLLDWHSSPTIVNCVFSGNSASSGGGMYCLGVPVVLANCTFSANSAAGGGGLYCFAGNPTLVNCTFKDNSADVGGGVVSNNNCSLTLRNTIIAFSVVGEAVRCSAGGSATLTCCDIYGNAGGNWIGCIGFQFGINGNLQEDPLFCGDANPDEPYTLRSDSPCALENNPECGLMGAWPVGCEPPVAAEHLTWSSVKALYR